jgi:Uma2 family endonuclease
MGQPLPKMTLAQFMAWEGEQATRHEFYRGETFGMVGGTRGHNRVVANLARHLGNHLDGTPCQVFSESMKVQVSDEAVLYPDVLVTCGKPGLGLSAHRRATFSALQALRIDPP